MKHVFITGAEGFIGSHITDIMLSRGYRVTALFRYNFTSDIGNLQHIRKHKYLKIITGDILDLPQMIDYTINADYIIHAAALIGIPYSYNAVHSYVDINIKGTANILEAARMNNIKRTLIISSSEVYGTAQYTPMDETHPRIPSSPYAATKLGAESLAQSYISSFNMPITILRPFNAYGPRQTSRAVIPAIITQAIQGKTIDLGRTDTMRDFNYVADIAAGIANALESAKCKGETLNLCSRKAYSIDEIITLVEEIKGSKLSVRHHKTRMRPGNSEVNLLLGDNSKALKLIDYKPSMNILRGLRSTYNWIYKHRFEIPPTYTI